MLTLHRCPSNVGGVTSSSLAACLAAKLRGSSRQLPHTLHQDRRRALHMKSIRCSSGTGSCAPGPVFIHAANEAHLSNPMQSQQMWPASPGMRH